MHQELDHGIRAAYLAPPNIACAAPQHQHLFFDLEDGQERLLGYLDAADALHPLLPLGLPLQQLALPGDIPALALGGDVLGHRPDRLTGKHLAADGGLDGDLEHLARYQVL